MLNMADALLVCEDTKPESAAGKRRSPLFSEQVPSGAYCYPNVAVVGKEGGWIIQRQVVHVRSLETDLALRESMG